MAALNVILAESITGLATLNETAICGWKRAITP
jgi:hypothetical protein